MGSEVVVYLIILCIFDFCCRQLVFVLEEKTAKTPPPAGSLGESPYRRPVNVHIALY